MLGGVLVQFVADRTGLGRFIDRGNMERIQGLALDALVIAALASLSLDAIADNILPFLFLALAGLVWHVFVLIVFAPRFVQSDWVDRGVADCEQGMRVAAPVLLLLRMADPREKSPAFEAVGYNQLVFDPFFCGALVTAAAIPLLVQLGPYPLVIF